MELENTFDKYNISNNNENTEFDNDTSVNGIYLKRLKEEIQREGSERKKN